MKTPEELASEVFLGAPGLTNAICDGCSEGAPTLMIPIEPPVGHLTSLGVDGHRYRPLEARRMCERCYAVHLAERARLT